MGKRITKKVDPELEKLIKKTAKARAAAPKKEDLKKPALRTIYSNSKYTLMTLGFGSDFKTKKCVVIFSDLPTGQVHTTTLSVWNRMKLKEVKDIKPQT